jgi:hypothetical protein
VREAQACLAQETEQYQRTINEAFLKSAGEIRGRIHQAVEMAGEPIEARSRDIQAEIVTLAGQISEELREEMETARQRLQSSCEESQCRVANALQQRSAETLERLQEETQLVTQNSIERWQSALNETLAAIPQMQSTKLTKVRSSAATAGDEQATEHQPEAEDGRP